MARSINTMLRFNLNLLNKDFVKYAYKNGTRLLYSRSSLFIDKYESVRRKIHRQLISTEDIFRKKMHKLVDDNSSQMILTDDMKLMLHLVDSTPEDMELIMKMIKKFNLQDKRLRFDEFAFGPIVMRALYYLNEPDVAFSIYTDPELKDFFDYNMSHHILMNLLYNNQRYENVMTLYNIVKTIFDRKEQHYSKMTVILALATCYKQNTAESLKNALEIINDLNEKGVIPFRAILFATGLALKQNLPNVALETISKITYQDHSIVRYIKAGIYADLNELNNVLILFKMSHYFEQEWTKNIYFADMVEKIENAIARANIDANSEIIKLMNELKCTKCNKSYKTLDDYLNSTIEWRPSNKYQQFQYENSPRLRATSNL